MKTNNKIRLNLSFNYDSKSKKFDIGGSVDWDGDFESDNQNYIEYDDCNSIEYDDSEE
ncbi:MAG: hypothetical protein SPK18_08020 [Treponema sp.]|nr:hypothetical protein [Spirochaetia bacterium]MDD7533530.1 hypothetical protein [Treponema sp.]MDY3722705.1 hypothetical protein [Treponema sp.]MDY5758510.1 hypothetical protein [Treponema sp.]MDY5819268.1 hypothetical protein [Treponema sp.]